MMISLSILEYESSLSEHEDKIEESEALSQIIRLIQTGKIHRVHIDVMRPPMIPGKTKFSTGLIRRLYENLHDRIALAVHLMVMDPFAIVKEINGFTTKEERSKMIVFLQRESFGSEDETIRSLDRLKEYGYKAGICLNLPTPRRTLTRKIVEAAETILLMSVPMGEGGQKYSRKATARIAYFSRKFPNKTIEVDGGITPETIALTKKAGARIAVVGSFITQNKDPVAAIAELE